ncbi:MAG: serine/threonine protein kinase [Candidatus Obscuribacterales bacterium]|jgi:serine/threonine protein kinase|nr:serine/threonine protein kinase [Candidatus Obscuribacterales bacterium]
MDTIALVSGAVFDAKFFVMDQLGAGGMGAVYKAKQIGVERVVALKLLNSILGDFEDSAARFEREAKILSVLEHRNIARFFLYAISADHVPYLAMEFVSGQSLRKRFSADKKQPWKWSVEVAIQICDALSYAHSQGVVHRDLKPENIMVAQTDGDDRIVLIDFGLSKITDPQLAEVQKLTKTGDLIGSVNYISPELCKGLKPDARSDIYALGVILYEAISGRLPFSADSPIGVIYKHANEPPAPLDERSLAIPSHLKHIIHKCIAKDPAQRYQSADAVREDLKALLDNRLDQILLPAETEAGKKNVLLSGLAVAISLVLLLACLTIVSSQRKQIDPNKVLEKPKKDSASALITENTLSLLRTSELESRVDALLNSNKQTEAQKLVLSWQDVHSKRAGMTPADIAASAILLGKTYGALNDYSSAVKVYKEAVEKLRQDQRTIPTDLIPLLSAQIGATGWLGRKEEMEEPTMQLEEILKKNPDLPGDVKDKIRYQIAVSKTNRRLSAEALNYMDQECRDSIDQKSFSRLRAICLFRLGRIDEGKAMALACAQDRSNVRDKWLGRHVDADVIGGAREAATCAEQAYRYDIAIEILEPAVRNSPPIVDQSRAVALSDLASWSLLMYASKGHNQGKMLDRHKDKDGWRRTLETSIRRSKESAAIFEKLRDRKSEFRQIVKVAYLLLLAGDDIASDQEIASLYDLFPPKQKDDVTRWAASQMNADAMSAFSSGWHYEAARAFAKTEELYSLLSDADSVAAMKSAKAYQQRALKSFDLEQKKDKQNSDV